jgi:hypothetical protein
MGPDRRSVASALALLAGLWPAAAAAEDPLSAIDWLSDVIAAPAPALPAGEPPASPGGLPGEVTVTVIGAPSPDGAGLLPTQVTGLPRALWGLGVTEEIAALIAGERADALPALKALFFKLLLAEAEPPPDAAGRGLLLLARIDKLLAMGALDQAAALIAAAGPAAEGPAFFRRSFDIAMLTGTEDAACEVLAEKPDLAPTFPARIFCLARSGDWNAAALALRTGQALGSVTPYEDALMSRFLDPDLYEGEPPLGLPDPVTPLTWRMLEAIGEAPPTTALPLAFSHADLRESSGWKARLEAAERLTRAGAVEPNLLLGLYSERDPAASGGVWDRVAAFQDFEAALRRGDGAAIAAALPVVWERMAEAELEVPFATLFAADLARHRLPVPADALAFRIALLSPDYEAAAQRRSPADLTESFLAAVARGDLAGVTPPDSLARAIAPAFVDGAVVLPADLESMIAGGRTGEAVLIAIDRISRGVQGDLAGVTAGLAALRRLGLEDAARRTALELMLLERRG